MPGFHLAQLGALVALRHARVMVLAAEVRLGLALGRSLLVTLWLVWVILVGVRRRDRWHSVVNGSTNFLRT